MTSFVLTVRDAEATLGDALDNCIAQTAPELEIVVVENRSSDRTREVIDRCA